MAYLVAFQIIAKPSEGVSNFRIIVDFVFQHECTGRLPWE
jgi:hypothetical protein